ncbi:hypothetical protein LguiB_032557 [Lonicera macranthoides]
MIRVSISKTLIYILPRQFFCLFMGSVKDDFFMDHCRRVLNLYTKTINMWFSLQSMLK